MRSLRMKLILIMVLLIIALMTVVGSFLINGVETFYTTQFYSNMEQAFSTDFIAQLQALTGEADAPQRLREQLMAQADLAIDLSNRNVYVLDQDGRVLAGSDDRASITTTANLLTAMAGQVGQASSIIADYMDVAVPVSGESSYIVYVLDNKATVNALTSEVITIILESLGLGLLISVVLAVLLAQILIRPIQALTRGARQMAAGSFSETLEVTSADEIGTLTENFNEMAKILQDTLDQVKNERNKLSTLFLHMTDGVVAFDATGTIIHYNPAAASMLGVNLQAEGQSYDSLFADVSPLPKLLQIRKPNFIEAQRQAGDRELELFLAPFSEAESQGGVLAVIHDVTVQRRNEEMNREFVANVSHELRTPLTNVRSYTETILDAGDELPAETKQEFLTVVLNETDRMTRIVQDLLTLSRFDSGRMEMNFTRFSFRKAVENVYQAVTMSAQEHGHILELNLAPEIPMLDGDQQRIEQVLMNIVSNAIKYTPDGGHISISAGRQAAAAWVNVTDNGIGIPEADIPRLFERFYRVDKARSRESGGTGLGLSIALEILNLHKGEIHVESQVGQGTSVTITLPAAAKGALEHAPLD